jgi:hypothetical protein
MSKRTTIHLAALKAKANAVFRTSENDYADGRKHIQSFVESVLMDARQYRGFGYLSKDKVDPGKSFGIEFTADNEPKFHDQTRIEFF